jgi:hypothetical protein
MNDLTDDIIIDDFLKPLRELAEELEETENTQKG